MATVVTYMGLKWNEAHDKVVCPFHIDKTPSLQVNKSTVFCHACKRTWDVYQFLMDYLHIDFEEAVGWLLDNAEDYGAVLVKQQVARKPDYRGPAPTETVYYFIKCLKPEHRLWLREERLLTDETIEQAGIGWHSELKAYTIPFWRGVPHQSEIDIVQYRSTPQSPPIHGDKDWRYIGMKHHNRPSILNSHLFTGRISLTFFGSFDALYAGQEKLAAGSINGSNVFLKEDNLPRLKSYYHPTAQNIIIPDMVSSEVEPAYRMALNVPGGCVKHFPPEWEWYNEQGERGKDYTHWGQSGRTAWDFINEVIMRNQKLILLNNNTEREYIDNILECMAQGDWEATETYLACLEPKHVAKVVTHALMLRAQHAPHDTFTGDEWSEFCVELETAHQSYFDLAVVVKRWTLLAYDRMGGF